MTPSEELNRFVLEGKFTFHTFAYLIHAARSLAETAKEHQLGSNHSRISAVLFSAFAVEAHLNHVGFLKNTGWASIERTSWKHKLNALAKEFRISINYGHRPFQTVSLIFEFRNKLAHGRTVHKQPVFKVFDHADPQRTGPLDPEWLTKYWSDEAVQKVLDDSRQVVEIIQKAAALPNHELDLIGSGSYSERAERKGDPIERRGF